MSLPTGVNEEHQNATTAILGGTSNNGTLQVVVVPVPFFCVTRLGLVIIIIVAGASSLSSHAQPIALSRAVLSDHWRYPITGVISASTTCSAVSARGIDCLAGSHHWPRWSHVIPSHFLHGPCRKQEAGTRTSSFSASLLHSAMLARSLGQQGF